MRALGLGGDAERARASFNDSLQRFVELGGDVTGIAECLEGLAAFEDDPLEAARLAGRAEAIRLRNRSHPLPFDAAAITRALEPKKASVGDDHWNQAIEEGRAQPPPTADRSS